MDKVYQAMYAGHPVRFAFLDPRTRQLFKFWLKPVDGASYDVMATPELLERVRPYMPENSQEYYVEYKALIGPTSEFLLQYRCCIFHAVAFLWNGRAWLLTAPSGTGKSTQFLNWRRLHPGEITMISGDMPLLEQRDDGNFWVYATNWNGKEGIGSFFSAPLGGIILLEQGKENQVESLPAREAIPALLQQFGVFFETEKEILTVCEMLDGIMSRYPAWKLVNRGDDASTELLRRTLAERTGGANETI